MTAHGLRPRRLILLLALLVALSAVPAAAEEHAAQTTLVSPPFGHCLGINRATTFHLFVYLGNRTRFDEPAGVAAVKLLAEDDPSTGRDDDELTVLGLNSGRSEIIYNTSLTNVEIYGEPGGGVGQFREPLGIAADASGAVVVADTGNDRLVRLRYVDDELRHAGWIERVAATPPELSSPSQVALGHSGTVYVTDTGNDRVLAIPPAGGEARSVASGVTLRAPTGLAVVEDDDPWLNRRDGRIVVADSGGTRLLSFDLAGTLRDSAAVGAAAPAWARFDHLAIDYHGSVYATDTRASVIHKFDRRLEYVTAFGRPGEGDLDEPRGIAIWRRFGQLFVTERQGARYFWMGTEIRDLTADAAGFRPGVSPLRIRYDLTEVSRVTVVVLDGEGHVVHTLAENRRRAIGPNVERWDGIHEDGGTLAPGSYMVRVVARPVYSSREYFHDTAEVSFALER